MKWIMKYLQRPFVDLCFRQSEQLSFFQSRPGLKGNIDLNGTPLFITIRQLTEVMQATVLLRETVYCQLAQVIPYYIDLRQVGR